jgi:hypothetical protein
MWILMNPEFIIFPLEWQKEALSNKGNEEVKLKINTSNMEDWMFLIFGQKKKILFILWYILQ